MSDFEITPGGHGFIVSGELDLGNARECAQPAVAASQGPAMAKPSNGTVYRVVNLETSTIVDDALHDEDKARERLGRELGRVPGGRFAVEVRIAPSEEWLVVGTVGGFAR
jgi:hypothetical protein